MYRVDLLRNCQKSLDKIQLKERSRILASLVKLEENPRPNGVDKLRGSEYLRIREGDYRIIYLIDDKNKIVTVTKIGHRREIYRDF